MVVSTNESPAYQAALSHLHERQVLHNDISPDNIMVRVGSESSDGKRSMVFYLVGSCICLSCGDDSLKLGLQVCVGIFCEVRGISARRDAAFLWTA